MDKNAFKLFTMGGENFERLKIKISIREEKQYVGHL